jgi:long-chain acyl-CoA synthetase
VVIFLDNSVEAVIALYGTLMAGGVFIIPDSSMKSKKLAYILGDSGASIMIAHGSKEKIVREAQSVLDRPCTTIWVGEAPAAPVSADGAAFSWQEISAGSSGSEAGNRTPASGQGCIDRDLAALIYTSGSTGEPKGVMSSHANMVSAARSIIQYLENRSDDIILSVLPLSFDYGLYQVVMAVMFGGTVVLERSFVYPAAALELLQRERATGFPLVPTIAAFLVKMKGLEQYDLRSLRYLTNTAAALPAEHIRRLRELLPQAKLFSMYGLTECKRVSYLPPEELDRRPLSVGKAIPNTEVLIVDASGQEVAAGEVGELVVRGAHVMCGYWNAPELTAATFRPGRFPGERLLYSGDYFRRDDEGFLYFVGRKDDLIKTRGERVSPREVENALCEMKGIVEAAVFGVPDEILGQAITACVVWSDGVRPNEREILKFCSDRLQPFMIPRRIVFMEVLPKSPNGKVDKKALKSGHQQTAVPLQACPQHPDFR